MDPAATKGPMSLDCEYLLSRTEVEALIRTRVESVQVSYGDGAGCQYQTSLGPANIISFTGPVAEQMWTDRPAGSPGLDGPVEINIVDGWPVGHVPGRWLTIRGRAFESLAADARIRLVTMLLSRL